jgi:hypothetical protein
MCHISRGEAVSTPIGHSRCSVFSPATFKSCAVTACPMQANNTHAYFAFLIMLFVLLL